jgi:hypothetical protein
MFALPSRPMTPDELRVICQVWQDKGSDDPTGQWLELWDGGDADEFPKERDAIIAIAADCGLPTEMERGVLRVRKTQQLHDETARNWR